MTRPLAFRKKSQDEGIWKCVVVHNEYKLPTDLTGWHVVDIGAHIGSFSRLTLDRNAASVQSFEGNAENHAILCVNAVSPRCVPRLAVVHGDAPKEHPLEVAGFSWPNTGGGNATPQAGSTVENIHASGLGHQLIDFLKLDCEGFEFDILTSMDLSKVQRIALEFHENQTPPRWKKAAIPHTCEALAAHLEQRGFAVSTMRHDGSRFGKIFASRTTDWLPKGNQAATQRSAGVTPSFVPRLILEKHGKNRSTTNANSPARDEAPLEKALPLRRRSSRRVPRPPGATVELQRATGREPELLRHRAMLEAVCGVRFPYPEERFAGRGVVICGGGEKYLPSVVVLVRLLRHLRCRLPIEVWHLGKEEMPDVMRTLLAESGVACRDGEAMRRVHPARRLGGWELKCYALLHSSFAEVLLLDADNCPVRDPAFLFRSGPYREHGAVFWPDYSRFARGQAVWVASGIPYRDEPEFESGQILVDKARCWQALNVAMHLNEHSDWWYRVVHGDKDTFHLAWRKLGQPYAMPARPAAPLEATMLQHDFAGRRLFQHRNFAKWTLEGNRRIPGFRLEEECLGFLAELRARWQPDLPLWVRKWERAKAAKPLRAVAARLCRAPLDYLRAGLGRRTLEFRRDGTIGKGAAGCERWWDLRLVKVMGAAGRPARIEGGGKNGAAAGEPPEARTERRVPPTVQLEVFGEKGLTFRARPVAGGGWSGAWVAYDRTAITLRPIRARGKKGTKGGRRSPKGKKRGIAGKNATFDARKPSRKERAAVPLTPKRAGNGTKPVRQAPIRAGTVPEALRHVPKPVRNGRKPLGNMGKRALNGRAPAGDTLFRNGNGGHPLGHAAKGGRNGREPFHATPGRRQSAP